MTHVIGHQGAPRVAPANTVAAFEAARAIGADGVELDVRRAAGGDHLAVSHDDRLADGRALLDTPVVELPATMPDLTAALDACAGLSVVNVEIKNWPADADYDAELTIAERVAELLAGRPAPERDRLIVSCFHLATVDRVREVAPELATAWLMLGFSSPERDVATAVEHGHRAIHPHHSAVDADVVGLAHAAGLAVNTWTCDEPDRIRWLAGTGVDGIVTNVPDVALALLGRVAG
jgi:glycerophosphoryl diester phosphodiesterase